MTLQRQIGFWVGSLVVFVLFLVVPVSYTHLSSACRCVCVPLNSGSSDGWMLIIRPSQRATNQGVRMRICLLYTSRCV